MIRRAGLAFILALPAMAEAAPRDDAVFCTKDAGGAHVLAVASTKQGQLRFGISIWSAAGQNISVFGTAASVAGGWRYVEPGAGACRLDFTRDDLGGFVVRADPAHDCHRHGGLGARIGTVTFPSSRDEGPVAKELDDAESFQHAGRCAGAE